MFGTKLESGEPEQSPGVRNCSALPTRKLQIGGVDWGHTCLSGRDHSQWSVKEVADPGATPPVSTPCKCTLTAVMHTRLSLPASLRTPPFFNSMAISEKLSCENVVKRSTCSSSSSVELVTAGWPAAAHTKHDRQLHDALSRKSRRCRCSSDPAFSSGQGPLHACMHAVLVTGRRMHAHIAAGRVWQTNPLWLQV